MKKFKLIMALSLLTVVIACNAQQSETFWKATVVTKIDRTPFWGVTASYMEMIYDMNIHLSTHNDSIEFNYPVEKSIKISELKSLTDCVIPSTGQLLDSVYEVKVDGDTLRIKFVYNGSGSGEKRFSLNLSKIKKEDFLKEVSDLKSAKEKVLDQIKEEDLSDFTLIKKPAYLAESNYAILNPKQLAEELTDQKNALQFEFSEFSLEKNKNKINYETSGIINTDKIKKAVAQINQLKFNNIETTNIVGSAVTNAVIVSQNDMPQADIIKLYSYLSKKLATAKLTQFGLPMLYKEGDSLGIHNFLAVTWMANDKVIKLAIDDISDDLWDMEIHDGVALRENYSTKDVDAVFRHYLSLIKKSKVRVFIVSKDFDEILNLKENESNSLASNNIQDYVVKWKSVTELTDN